MMADLPVECAGSVEHLQKKRGGRITVDLGCLIHSRARPSMREASSLQLCSARDRASVLL